MKVLKWVAVGFVGLVVLGAVVGSPEKSENSSNVSASEGAAEKAGVNTNDAAPPAAAEPEPVEVEHEGPFITRKDQVTLRGTVNISGVGVKVDGKRAAVTGKKWTKVVTIKKKGENEFRVIAFKKDHESDATMAAVDRELTAAEKAVVRREQAARRARIRAERAARRREQAARRAGARALASAESYLEMSGFSKQGLYEQLSSSAGEGFTAAEAQYAVDHVDADWNQEAVESARSYLEMSPMSRESLIEQLSSDAGEKFTYEQAVYAVNKVY
jgi:hypothetical protein